MFVPQTLSSTSTATVPELIFKRVGLANGDCGAVPSGLINLTLLKTVTNCAGVTFTDAADAVAVRVKRVGVVA
ncbi:hypothetical protein SAMN04487926_1637 [Paraburkholderia steynii]|uniref:Uncharacterized protein n=1 Tax=Paraburkholderia steynii TaxID=1245441 RepID=A0A7Z7BLY3_9BURK|nr:hypothetical protein SAMN04487926_1637 [Paraburkholderia steynii]